jgi:hypothetical protein
MASTEATPGSGPPRSRGRRLGRAALAIAALLALLLAGAWGLRHEIGRRAVGLPPFRHALGGTQEISLPMRDGVALATTVVRPAGPGPFPTLLTRSPYPDLRRPLSLQCEVYARYGYACVLQDARGRGGSGGAWTPYVHEREDGLDTLAWLVAQPWVDGNVGLIGASYLAFTQWVVADALPPQVKTLVPAVWSPDYRATLYERGMFRNDVYTSWTIGNSGLSSPLPAREQFLRAVRHRPQIEVDERFLGGRLPWYREWLAHPEPEAALWSSGLWAQLRGMPERTAVPVLMLAGWYDHNLAGMFEAFDRLLSRDRSALVVGPWLHTTGAAAERFPSGYGPIARITLRWLDHHLKGASGAELPSGVEAFVLNEGFRRFETWPPPAEPLRLHLLAGAGSGCPGSLDREPAPEPATLSYRYDPDHPAPPRGGDALFAGLLGGLGAPEPGSVLQEPPCIRPDVLSFLSEPLQGELTVAGRVAVHLHVASSAEDTAFAVKLSEVEGAGGGRAFNIRDSIASLAWAEPGAPRPHPPGSALDLDYALWPIAWQLPEGARLRLDVTSSNTPAYHVHPNRYGPWAEQREAQVARQTVHVGGPQGAWIELPVLSERAATGARPVRAP